MLAHACAALGGTWHLQVVKCSTTEFDQPWNLDHLQIGPRWYCSRCPGPSQI